MRVLLSPAKTFRKEELTPEAGASQPVFLREAASIMAELSTWSPSDLAQRMHVSASLSEETAERHLNWSTPFHPGNARLAVLSFHGEVYRAMGADRWNTSDFDFAQDTLRIISGLYGLLRPLDLVQEYRLEMGTPWAPKGGKNLYSHWNNTLSEHLEQDAAGSPIVNLASAEYAKALKLQTQTAPVVTCAFKEEKQGSYKMIGTYAKHARGRMAAFIVKNRITELGQLHAFDEAGYTYNPALSSDSEFVFTRTSQNKK